MAAACWTRRPRRATPFSNMQAFSVALVMIAAIANCVEGVEIMFRNACGKEMLLSNGKTAEKIKKDGSLKKTLAVGAVEAFRLGTGNQATLAEFSVQEGATWYDIGIIPTGTFIGPGNCSSLENCKQVTGGTGFNVAMKIVPGLREDEFYHDTCTTVDCFADGCPDAYHYPNDPNKTKNCPSNVHFTVVFCASPSTGSSDGSLGWNGELESAVVTSAPPVALSTTPVAETSPPPMTASTAHADDGGDGTSVAVIIASIIGGFVTIFAAVILVRRWRYTRLEKMNAHRYSSEAMIYVEARDVSAL